MKRKGKKAALLIGAAVLMALAIAILCFGDTIQLRLALNRYRDFLNGQVPEGTTLTIYYVPDSVVFRRPPAVEDLINMAEENQATKIVVQSHALTKNIHTLKQLTTAQLHPLHEDTFVYARIYYVFETPEREKLLDVALWTATNEDFQFGVLVNGIMVDDHPVFLDILVPFLTEEDLEALNITLAPEGAVYFTE